MYTIGIYYYITFSTRPPSIDVYQFNTSIYNLIFYNYPLLQLTWTVHIYLSMCYVILAVQMCICAPTHLIYNPPHITIDVDEYTSNREECHRRSNSFIMKPSSPYHVENTCTNMHP